MFKTSYVVNVDDKPFSCRVCQKSFSQKCDLSRHETVHSGQKITSNVSKTTFVLKRASCDQNDKIHILKKITEKDTNKKNLHLINSQKTFEDQKCNTNSLDVNSASTLSKTFGTQKTSVPFVSNKISDVSNCCKQLQLSIHDTQSEIYTSNKRTKIDKGFSDSKILCNESPTENSLTNFYWPCNLNGFKTKVPNKYTLNKSLQNDHTLSCQPDSLIYNNKDEEIIQNPYFSYPQQPRIGSSKQETSENCAFNMQLNSQVELNHTSIPFFSENSDFKQTKNPACNSMLQKLGEFNRDVKNFSFNKQIYAPVMAHSDPSHITINGNHMLNQNVQTYSSHDLYYANGSSLEVSQNQHVPMYNTDKSEVFHIPNSECSKNSFSNQQLFLNRTTNCKKLKVSENVSFHLHPQSISADRRNILCTPNTDVAKDFSNQNYESFNNKSSISDIVPHYAVSDVLPHQDQQNYNKKIQNFVSNQHLQTCFKEKISSDRANPAVVYDVCNQELQTSSGELDSQATTSETYLQSKHFKTQKGLNVTYIPNIGISNISSYHYW